MADDVTTSESTDVNISSSNNATTTAMSIGTIVAHKPSANAVIIRVTFLLIMAVN